MTEKSDVFALEMVYRWYTIYRKGNIYLSRRVGQASSTDDTERRKSKREKKGSKTKTHWPLHCKKRLDVFPSPAGTSLTKLSLAGNNYIIPGQGEIPAGDGNIGKLFFPVQPKGEGVGVEYDDKKITVGLFF